MSLQKNLWVGEWSSFFMSLGLTTFGKLRYIHCTPLFASLDTTKSSTCVFTRVIRNITITIWVGSIIAIVQSSSDYLNSRRHTSHKALPTKPVQSGPPPLIGVFSTLQFSWPFPQRLCMKSNSSLIKDVKAVIRKSFCPSLWMPHSFVFWPPHLQVTRGWSYLENGGSGSIFSKQATVAGLRGVKSWHGQKSDSNDLRCQDDSFTSKSPIRALMYRFTQPEKHAS